MWSFLAVIGTALISDGLCGAGLALVHIGKTGGSSISMNVRHGCHAWWKEKYNHGKCPPEYEARVPYESEISNQVLDYWHMHRVPVDRYSSFLVTVRDPVDRIASFFPAVFKEYLHRRFHRRKQTKCDKYIQVFFKCFKSVNKLAESLPGPKVAPESLEAVADCPSMAWRSIRGEESCASHLTYNYQFYAGSIVDHKPAPGCTAKKTFVLRTKHLAEDWPRIDTMLGGSGARWPGTKERSSHNSIGGHAATNRTFSPVGIANLCRALGPELEVHAKLINSAVNLNLHEKSDYLASMKCYNFTRAR